MNYETYSCPSSTQKYSSEYFSTLTFAQATNLDYPPISPDSIPSWVWHADVPGSAPANLILPSDVVPHLADLQPILKKMPEAFSLGSRSVILKLVANGEEKHVHYHFAKTTLLRTIPLERDSFITGLTILPLHMELLEMLKWVFDGLWSSSRLLGQYSANFRMRMLLDLIIYHEIATIQPTFEDAGQTERSPSLEIITDFVITPSFRGVKREPSVEIISPKSSRQRNVKARFVSRMHNRLFCKQRLALATSGGWVKVWHITTVDLRHNHDREIPEGGHIRRPATKDQKELITQLAVGPVATTLSSYEHMQYTVHWARREAELEGYRYKIKLDENQKVTGLWWQSGVMNGSWYAIRIFSSMTILPIGMIVATHLVLGSLLTTLERVEMFEAAAKPPEVFASDRDHALITTIANILPLTFHLYCLHHLNGNVSIRTNGRCEVENQINKSFLGPKVSLKQLFDYLNQRSGGQTVDDMVRVQRSEFNLHFNLRTHPCTFQSCVVSTKTRLKGYSQALSNSYACMRDISKITNRALGSFPACPSYSRRKLSGT
ncbi:SF3b1 domain-containing protein [Salix suchowensis]|nr:SF3b1 domain-containing protein [Salix suchowensis]